MLVSLFVWIGKRVTILLPIFFYHKLAQSLLTMGLGLVVTPPESIYLLLFRFLTQEIQLTLLKWHHYFLLLFPLKPLIVRDLILWVDSLLEQ